MFFRNRKIQAAVRTSSNQFASAADLHYIWHAVAAMATGKILIIDDEDRLRQLLSRIISLEGYEVVQASDCASGLKQLARTCPDAVLCDVKLPDGNGVELTARIKKESPATEVILLTAYGNISDGVRAVKNGAFDYITKGDDNDRIIPLLAQACGKAAAQRAKPAQAAVPAYSFDNIAGRSPALLRAVELARRVAATDTTVLLTGQTGTGKEIFARAIHAAGGRAAKPFVAVNCSAISHELLESELFGHRAGAFTGAVKDKKGLFDEADGGTVFLDEIGEMPADLQAKLLRVLESGEFIRVGDTKATGVNMRMIAATNRNLEHEIREGRFREDLYYRISVFRIELPPLSERLSDIPEYVRGFTAQMAAKLGKRIDAVTPEYLELLRRHSWHGNVRELRNVVERSMIMSEGNTLRPEDLPLEFHTGTADASAAGFPAPMAEMEKRHILRMLEHTGGNKTEAARLLEIGLTTLYRKLEEYGIPK